MPRFLNRFYIKFIRPTDPGLFITRYAGKATVCCLVALVIAWAFQIRGMALLWWLIGSLCTIMFRTGSTLQRRKMYGLILLAIASVTIPVAAAAGGHALLGLGFIFVLSFACFFVAPMGVSASTLGTGCLVVTMISFFSPAPITQGIIRSGCLIGGGLISFCINFYLWPFDPERVLLSSARLAVEDLGVFFDALSARVKTTHVTDAALDYLSSEAIVSVRRYRTFMESFNIDPLKGSTAKGGPGLYYFALIRLFESLMGLYHHIHFCDKRPEFEELKQAFDDAADDIAQAFDAFSEMDAGTYTLPDFDAVILRIENMEILLINMKGYKKGDQVQNKFLEAWGAVYELKNVVRRLQDMMALADKRFGLRADTHGA